VVIVGTMIAKIAWVKIQNTNNSKAFYQQARNDKCPIVTKQVGDW